MALRRCMAETECAACAALVWLYLPTWKGESGSAAYSAASKNPSC